MDFDGYARSGYTQYKEFAETVADILRAAISAQPPDYRVQQVQSRPKDPKSLKRKLAERGLSESTAIENELKDLAGCRVILYTNTDVDRFLSSRVIFENFEVDFDGSKIHHAPGSDRTADQLYFGIHYLVSMKEERLALPEYARFRGMRCEIQVQTILHHAWAETSHDILYHPVAIAGFGTKQFEAIKKRLGKIMNEYLLPAGYEFQKVQHDYERLLAGKELFDRGALERLGEAKNNNERQEQLKHIREDLLPLYDDVPAIAPDVIGRAAEAITQGRDTPTVKIKTPFGNFDGRTPEDVVKEGLKLIDILRFVDVELTFKTLRELYAAAHTDDERGLILKSVETLSQNDLQVWKQVGFGVQQKLHGAIRALSTEEREALRPVIIATGNKFLETELHGTTWHFNSVTIHRGSVGASGQYGKFRTDVISTLFELYDSSSSDVEKRQIERALGSGTRLPMDGGRDGLIEIVLDDTRKIVDFFANRTSGQPYMLLQEIEHQYLYLYRRSCELVAGKWSDAIKEKAGAVVAAIEVFLDRLNSDERFVKFKTLVGFQSVFPMQWDGDPFDIEGRQKYRSEQIRAYAASVSDANKDAWFEVVELCASVKSDDLATFPSFGEFLKELASRSPAIALEFLRRNEALLGGFIPAILGGLEGSKQPDTGLALANEWINRGEHLHGIAHYVRFTEAAPAELVAKVGAKAVECKDVSAAIGVIAAIISRKLTLLVDTVFVPIIRMFSELGDARWVNGIWHLQTLREFLAGLSVGQCQLILDNMVLRSRIEHHDEWILREIASQYPAIVWQFFKTRLDRESEEGSEERYEAVPFQMTELNKPLARDAALALRNVRSWYAPGDHMFQFTGGRLMHNVFPTFTKEFETELVNLVCAGKLDDIDFALSVLRSYDGGQFLHEVCKAVVAVLPDDERRLNEVEIILQSTGVVTGEFGMVQVYQARKEEVADWLADARLKVRAFAERYQRTLDRAIAAEQRRSESGHELRRMEWEVEE
jgi:ppGpp synthetase/RelA/SpoT-type nucleotidyltranferase